MIRKLDIAPIIVIGAARSGTNILRDLLTQLPGATTWRCDEINYLWRHFNARHPDDELTPSQATGKVCRYIRKAFSELARTDQGNLVIEKTCANSLRTPFVDAVLPEARFIFLLRDGRDVVTSAMQRWKAQLDLSYILKKARYVPLSDVPYYALRYAHHRIVRLTSAQHSLPTWGPRFHGIDTAVRHLSMEKVCSLQWKYSVELSDTFLSQLPDRRVCRIHYEQLVANPHGELQRICDWIGLKVDLSILTSLATSVSARSVSRWSTGLSPTAIEAIESICGPTLKRFGYSLYNRLQRAA